MSEEYKNEDDQPVDIPRIVNRINPPDSREPVDIPRIAPNDDREATTLARGKDAFDKVQADAALDHLRDQADADKEPVDIPRQEVRNENDQNGDVTHKGVVSPANEVSDYADRHSNQGPVL